MTRQLGGLLWLSLLLLLFFPLTAHGKKNLAAWDFWDGKASFWVNGQFRPRMEFFQKRDLRSQSKAGDGIPHDVLFIQHRVRLGVGAEMWKHLKIFVQLQDVRFWGEELNTLGDFDANGFDLHQGWARAEWNRFFVKAGRMEISYDSQRIIGAVGWTQMARSFNGVVTGYESKSIRLHLFYLRLREDIQNFSYGEVDANGVFQETGKENAIHANDSHLLGLWFRWQGNRYFKPSVYALLRSQTTFGLKETRGPAGNLLKSEPNQTNLLQPTLGTFINGGVGGFSYELEFFAQINSPAAGDLTFAWLLAFNGTYKFGGKLKPGITFWSDFVSGDGKVAFDTLFATNHKFYGWMDFFLNLPVHTKNSGLMDFGAGFKFFPTKGFMVRLDGHYFRLMTPLKDKDGTAQSELGVELDLIMGYSLLGGHLKFLAGLSTLVPVGTGFTGLGKGTSPEFWGFLQTDVKF